MSDGNTDDNTYPDQYADGNTDGNTNNGLRRELRRSNGTGTAGRMDNIRLGSGSAMGDIDECT